MVVVKDTTLVVTCTLVLVELLTAMVEVVSGSWVEDVEARDSELVVVFLDPPPPPPPPLEEIVVIECRMLVVIIALVVVLVSVVDVLDTTAIVVLV